MDIRDSVELVIGMPLMVITPALVELGKQLGLPVRYAGIAAMATAMLLLVCGDIALSGVPAPAEFVSAMARWVLGGVVYGLAAAGLYSQGRQIGQRTPDPGRESSSLG
jgi:hypothetical protein